MKKIRIGPLGIGSTPRIVGSVVSNRVFARLAGLAQHEFDIAEIRLDLVGLVPGWVETCSSIEAAGMPVLLTVRSDQEGGRWEGAEKDRVAVYEESLGVVSAIDMEVRSRSFSRTAGAAHRAKCTVVGSFHDFEKTPDKRVLRRVINEGRRKGADIVKIAAMINGREDIITLYELLRDTAGGPLCVIGMGPTAAHTRIGLPCAGSCLTYGYIDRSAAPGQLSCKVLAERLRESGGRS